MGNRREFSMILTSEKYPHEMAIFSYSSGIKYKIKPLTNEKQLNVETRHMQASDVINSHSKGNSTVIHAEL